MFQAPADPTLTSTSYAYSSYLMNTGVLNKDLSIQQISDGSSNTVLVAEGYSSCYGSGATKSDSYNYVYRSAYWPGYYYPGYTYSYSYDYTYTGSYYVNQGLTKQSYSYTSGSTYDPTFDPVAGKAPQDGPSTSQCDASTVQGFGGPVQVLLGDGSVRKVSSTINTTTWFGALTPDGGEVLTNW
jgi:hypothetical protein